LIQGLYREAKSLTSANKRAGFTIVAEYYEKAVSGADRYRPAPGLSGDAATAGSNGAKTIIVESPDRFTLHRGHAHAILLRQVLGAIAQFEKASAVAKLAVVRKRKPERV